MLLVSWAALASAWLGARDAEAEDCTRGEPIIVLPGTHQEVAPLNTQVFVSLAPDWAHYATYPSPEAKQKALGSSFASLKLCKVTPRDAWAEGEGCQALVVKWDVKPAPEDSRRLVLSVPKGPLEARQWYAVVAETSAGPARLAEFAVTDRRDDEPPTLGGVSERASVFGSSLHGANAKWTGLWVDAVFDDTTRDEALRFEVYEHTGDPKGVLRSAVLAFRKSSDPQPSALSLAEKGECTWGTFTFPKKALKRDFRVRAVDLAGNASAPRTVEVRGKPAPAGPDEPDRHAALPPLYYVPKLGVFSKVTVYRASGVAVSLLLLLALWGFLRRRR